jgi:hypothetical protein
LRLLVKKGLLPFFNSLFALSPNVFALFLLSTLEHHIAGAHFQYLHHLTFHYRIALQTLGIYDHWHPKVIPQVFDFLSQ